MSGAVGKPDHKCQFRCFPQRLGYRYKHAEETPKQKPPTGLRFARLRFSTKILKKYAEIRRNTQAKTPIKDPKQINPTGFKRGLKDPRFPLKIRFGWETEPTGPGNRDGIQEVFEVFKVFASYPVRLGNRTYRAGGEAVIVS